MQTYITSELTHFVGRSLADDESRYALLLRILRSGVLLDPRYLAGRDSPIFFFDIRGRDGQAKLERYFPDPYFEVREDGHVSANEFVAPEMVCFCDIPLLDLEIHTGKYSKFGLAFAKEVLIPKGANPVHYVATNAATPLRLIPESGGEYPDFFADEEEDGLLAEGQTRGEFLEKLKRRTFDLINRYTDMLEERFALYQRGKDDPAAMRAQLLAMVNFMTGTFCYVHGLTKVFDPALSDNDPKNYYMEREWRVIGRVNFVSQDVARVLLPRGFADRFSRDEPRFSGEVTEL